MPWRTSARRGDHRRGRQRQRDDARMTEGMQFDKGFNSPYFVTHPEEMKCILEDCYILIHERRSRGSPN
ncbi:MAG: hypothetical protein Ct9H300mP1_03390 [Planctomycetaceae bacterium]|nr:MAG: hypothetical protein Ct9H300mP1_03390 [Planctomycetaceae bacterium]